MRDDMPSPPEVQEIDQAADELTKERAELLFRWRWAIAGVLAFPLVSAGLWVLVAVLGQDLLGVGILGTVGTLVGAGTCLGYSLENRSRRLALQNKLDRLRSMRAEALAGRAKRSSAPYARYKEHLPSLAERYKIRAQAYRRGYVALQLIVIVGSLSASAITALAVSTETKWISIIVSLLVGIAASCSLTFRLRERGEMFQRTASDIEQEYRAAELQIGDYASIPNEVERFRTLVERVEALRVSQATKERNLEQPPDLHQSPSSGIGEA